VQIQSLAEDMQDVRRRCWRMLGADHPQTLAATVVLGSILRRLSGRVSEAARLLRDAERRYQSALPDHPYGRACMGLLAAVRSQGGSASQGRAASRAVPVLQDVADQLTGSVGEVHPLSLTAAAALTNALARAGELDASLKCGQETLIGFQALYDASHPLVLTSEANIWTIQDRLGYEPAPEDLRARYAAALGTEHPDLALFNQGKLIDIDFTPLPL
jgi:hypothetical protein